MLKRAMLSDGILTTGTAGVNSSTPEPEKG